MHGLRHLVAVVAIGLTGWAAALAARAAHWPQTFTAPPLAPRCTGTPLYDLRVLRSAAPRLAHATSAIVLRDGRLRAYWYEGGSEVGSDVAIWSADFDGTSWSEARTVIDIAGTAQATGRHIKSLGNPTIYRDASGALVLVYVSVGLGRWSGSSLNIMHSRDEGENWSTPRRLLTTPTLILSTLVRSPAVPMADGFTLLPVYQEFLARFSEALLLDPNGAVAGRRRIANVHGTIQPLVIVTGEREAIAFSRIGDRSGKLLISRTQDAGQSWTSQPSSLPNHDKPVAGTRLDSGALLVIHNTPEGNQPNGPFAFSLSDDGGTSWRSIGRLTHDRGGGIIQYPWLTVGADGTYHLMFTHSLAQGSELLHLRFNRDWIAQQGGPPCR